MRKPWTAFLVVLPLGVAGCGGGSDKKDTTAANAAPATSAPAASPAKSVTSAKVAISDFKFKPPSITVAKGGSLTFTNEDSAPHTATQKGGGFDTNTLKKGQSKKLTFDKAGTFAYYCQFHSFMTAKIIVK